MTKRLLAVYLILVVLLAALVPGCGPTTPTTGTIVVQATLCGGNWAGNVNYTLTPTGGSPVSGTTMPTTHSNMTPASWTCAFLGGGPPGAFLNSPPSMVQNLAAGGTITFAFDFELNQDAAIKWSNWTVNGTPIQDPIIWVDVCNVIDAHFQQWVNGCAGYNATLNETSWLSLTYWGGPPGGQVIIYVVDDWCAVNKTPVPRHKWSQVLSINNFTVHEGESFIFPSNPTILDLETSWGLVKGANYTKTINWFGISKDEPAPHSCVLFELVLKGSGQYVFKITASAKVDLVGATDVDPGNNNATSPELTFNVNVP